MNDLFYKLMFVTNKQDKDLYSYLKFVNIVARSGITSVQLREKNISDDALLKFGKLLKEILAPLHIPLIINDNINLALELDADGVHLGQTDGDIRKARQLLGTNKIIGVSINSLEQLHEANFLPINYFGCGAIFKTQSKINVATLWGLEGLKKVSSLSKHKVIAIGGVNGSNVNEIICAGANGIAAISAFHDAKDPGILTKQLRHAVGLVGDQHD